MTFLFILFSIALSYFSVPEVFPTLAPYRIQIFILIPSVVGTLMLVAKRPHIQWPQHFLVIGLWFAVVMSRLSGGWFGGALQGFQLFAVVVTLYFIISYNAYTATRIRIFCATISTCGVLMALQGIIAMHTGYL